MTDTVATTNSVGVIDMAGTVQHDGTVMSPEGLKEQLDIAEENPCIKAVVLRIDSGGGTATAGEEMALYVKEFSKPVVVSSASMNASAAYEISSQADYIFTAKTTAIGAIGTAMQVTDLSGLYEKLGINVDTIASAESKDSSYGTRPLTEEERAYYQRQVDQINETFIQTVAEGRGMSVEAVRVLATGMTFTGMEAVETGWPIRSARSRTRWRRRPSLRAARRATPSTCSRSTRIFPTCSTLWARPRTCPPTTWPLL